MAPAQTQGDRDRIADAEAKRVRQGWRRIENARTSNRNYHPLLQR